MDNALIRRETVVMVDKEDGISKSCLSVLQAVIYGLALLFLIAFFAVAGVFVFPIMLLIAILDKHVYGNKYANTNREKPQD